jgi:hypothetical protein
MGDGLVASAILRGLGGGILNFVVIFALELGGIAKTIQTLDNSERRGVTLGEVFRLGGCHLSDKAGSTVHCAQV